MKVSEVKNMNIAFAGTHGAGKTTLLNQMIKVFDKDVNFKYVTEVARKIIQRGYPLNQEANTDSYIHYINDQLKAENDIFDSSLFISDRTLLDPLAYALVNRTLPRPYVQGYFIEMLERVWLLEKERYDLYVYFPVEFPMIFDGVRPEDEEYRREVDKMILTLLNKHKVNYIEIHGTPAERELILLEIIEKKKPQDLCSSGLRCRNSGW
jgi:nicotinamide riboside kinase